MKIVNDIVKRIRATLKPAYV